MFFLSMPHQVGKLHLFLRNRMFKKFELDPHPNAWKRFLDKIIYAVAIFGPIITIPQILKIWIGKNATGVSLTTWGLWLIPATLWLLYGFAHEEKPIIVSQFAWLIVYMLVIIGTLLYG